MQVHDLKNGLSGTVRWGFYRTGEIAITIVDEGELIATATVNLEEWGADQAPADCVWIKAWSENDGMDRALADAGVVERHWIDEVWGGYGGGCRAVLARLTPAALADFQASGVRS